MHDSNHVHHNGLHSKNFIIKSIFIGVLIFAIFIGGFLIGNASKAEAESVSYDTALFQSVRQHLDKKFVFWKSSSTLPTAKELEYGIIKGYVDSFKDPYTVFMPPQEAKSFAENVRGSFGGVGMTVGMKDGNIVVIAPLKDSPAMKAGIKAGDVITAVDKKNMVGLTSEEAVSYIRGELDTEVTITVARQGEKETKDITITRKEIKIPTIDTEKKDKVFIIRLYNFSSESPKLFDTAINEFIQSGLKHLVIDLRSNPGGYLEAAVTISSHFLKEGQVVVSEKQGKQEAVLNHRSYGIRSVPAQTKVAVLVDGGSASASEIVAGALKDHGVATVVGVKTFGKGSVQELINLDEGASIKVTVAKWFTPNGVNISEHGIVPTVEVVATTTLKAKDGSVRDIQLEKAIEVVKTTK
ncbi:MAG: carboxy-terminal-processing protease, carboxyl-terminal processing protease [Candidatus Parcubacteria bacterium]|jgi:carboxyl-terminal processing protease